MTDSPKEYIEQMLQQIVGVEIEITRLIGKVKLSQDDEHRDARNAGQILIESDNREIGTAMLHCVNNVAVE
jgi:transcriptional regulator